MPIYEYRCQDCRRRVSIFFRSFSDVEGEPACPRCGGHNLTRLISRVAVVRSEDSRLDDLSDPSMLDGLDEDDPKSIARWMRKMSAEPVRTCLPSLTRSSTDWNRARVPSRSKKPCPIWAEMWAAAWAVAWTACSSRPIGR